MAKGYWLTRSQAIFATQKSPYAFDKLAHSLNRRGKNSHTKQFFVPESQCTDQYKSKNIPCQEQVGNDVLDQLVANVDFNLDVVDDDSLSKQLKQARLQKLKTDTKLLNEKLDQRKKLLFAQWSQRFFDQFSNHFGKLRNALISMHLNQEQINVFNQTLDNCLNNLQLSLDNIWNQFQEENEDGQN